MTKERDLYRHKSKKSVITGAVTLGVGAGVVLPLAIWSALRVSAANKAYDALSCTSSSSSSTCDAIETDRTVFFVMTILGWVLGPALTTLGVVSLINSGTYKRKARALDAKLKPKVSLRPWVGPRGFGLTGRF